MIELGMVMGLEMHRLEMLAQEDDRKQLLAMPEEERNLELELRRVRALQRAAEIKPKFSIF